MEQLRSQDKSVPVDEITGEVDPSYIKVTLEKLFETDNLE
jgi:hypothetical protein